MNSTDMNNSIPSIDNFLVETSKISEETLTKQKDSIKEDENFEEFAIKSVISQGTTDKQVTILPISSNEEEEKIQKSLSLLPSIVKKTISSERPSDILKINWELLSNLPLEDQAFIHFANSVMINGIICRKRAEILEIIQVSSLDKNPRPENEIEVNAYKDKQAMVLSLYDSAKGGIPILLERKNDKPPLDTAPLTQKQEETLSTMGSMAAQFREILKKNNPLILNDETGEVLRELEKRAHAGMLILIDPSKLKLKDNDNHPIKDVKETSNAPWIEEGLSGKSSQACLEVKMDANIASSCFSFILVPKYFEQYKSFFVSQDNLVFVDSTVTDVTYNFPPPENSNKTNTSVTVRLSHPNFATKVQEFLKDKIESEKLPYIIQHITKGPRPTDDMFEKYWSKAGPDQYDKWLSH